MKELFTEEILASFRQKFSVTMSEKRWHHTEEVEKMVARLCALYCPEKTGEMRFAALCHDLTKEKKKEEQIALFREFHIPVTAYYRLAPKTFHAVTASRIVARDYPDYATPTVLSAIRYHTTGRKNMTLTESLLYLADYIDMSRKHQSCVALRDYFFSREPEKMEMPERLAHLRKTMILSFQYTLVDLSEEGTLVAPDTVGAYNQLLIEEAKEKKKK